MGQRTEIGFGLVLGAIGSLGWFIHPVGYVALVIGILLILHAGYEWATKRDKAQRNVTEQRHAAHRLTERRLTDDEMEMLLDFNETVKLNHDHGDFSKLEEDCLKEGELMTGLCSCGRPRNLPRWLWHE